MSKVLRTMGALTVVGLGAFASLDAVAAAVSVPGSTCEATGGGAVLFSGTGSIRNAGATPMTAVCPMTYNQASPAPVAATVWALDQNGGANVVCQLATQDVTGTVTTWGGAVMTVGAGAAAQALALPLPGIADNHYFVNCTVPAAAGVAYSGVVAYRLVQP